MGNLTSGEKGSLEFCFVSGSSNGMADVLSRWTRKKEGGTLPTEETIEAESPGMTAFLNAEISSQGRQNLVVAHAAQYNAKTTPWILQQGRHPVNFLVVDKYVKECVVCQRFRANYKKNALGSLPMAQKFNEWIGVDWWGPTKKDQ